MPKWLLTVIRYATVLPIVIEKVKQLVTYIIKVSKD